MEKYEILKDCWINGKLFKKSQLAELSQLQAKEWLDRKCVKLVKETISTQEAKKASNK